MNIIKTKNHTGVFSLYDHHGSFMGIANTDTGRATINDVQYVAGKTCHKIPSRTASGMRISKCSECGQGIGDIGWSYCPKCGARIIEDVEVDA